MYRFIVPVYNFLLCEPGIIRIDAPTANDAILLAAERTANSHTGIDLDRGLEIDLTDTVGDVDYIDFLEWLNSLDDFLPDEDEG